MCTLNEMIQSPFRVLPELECSLQLSLTHLKLALTGKDADPFVVIVRNDDVTVGVDGHTRRPLQLARSPSSDTEAAFELAII